MKKFGLKKNYVTLLLLFIIVCTFCLFLRNGLIKLPYYVDANVVVVANLILFLLALVGTFQHAKALKNPNPNVFIRSIMLMTVLKFLILGIAAVAYVLIAKETRNVPAIIISLILYVIYSVFETRDAFIMNKNSNKNG
ncbi:MAG TPA: hypothetical protein VFQ86_10890 [Arachidicoccus soli]|uniref:ATP synthase subunit I n=1 Tax=Arachidicoccus soli TaxID=2341117 RepID=A0A386HMC4_9BACT|nr:hypothetical protein [Arachidicoccus soli]AYD46935.1 hypothetical protein D6B99_04490 [Arachidicoccus soli]HEU0228237.1 hypothetical protein [Arachidicoccus soli]